MTTIGERVKELRSFLGSTQAKFAEQIGIHVGMLKKYEANRTVPGGEVLASMADIGVNLHWLITGVGPMQSTGHGPEGGAAKSITEIFDAAYSERVHRPATGTLPEMLRQDIPEENEYFNVLWPLFAHLWATRQLRWLPDHITLEQAAGLVSEAAELSWLRARGQPRGDKVNPEINFAFARTVLHKAWVVHMADEPTEDEADEPPSPGMS